MNEPSWDDPVEPMSVKELGGCLLIALACGVGIGFCIAGLIFG